MAATRSFDRGLGAPGRIPISGTWQTFDVEGAPAALKPLAEVVRRFVDAGGRVIDSSPMYGRSEARTGDAIAAAASTAAPFLATKVWADGRAAGIAQMKTSFQRMQTKRMDLMQIHNLRDWKTHLPVLREMRAAELDCATWAQFFLKFILGNPAVNCPIPATRKPDYVTDNVQAGAGRLPDEATRRKMIALLEA